MIAHYHHHYHGDPYCCYYLVKKLATFLQETLRKKTLNVKGCLNMATDKEWTELQLFEDVSNLVKIDASHFATATWKGIFSYSVEYFLIAG